LCDEEEMNGNEIDMRMFAQRAGASVSYAAGSIVFNKNDPGSCMYIVQSGVIEMMIGDTVVETCGPNEAIGFMSMVDGAARSSTARVKEAASSHSSISANSASWSMRYRTSRSTSWAPWRGASVA
jgi:Cyclic nucleotide-binding domain